MADKRMNQFTTATNGAYIYGESSAGNQVRIAKNDIIRTESTTIFNGDFNDLDNFAKSGLTIINVNTETVGGKNTPTGASTVHGVLEVIARVEKGSTSINVIAQKFYDNNGDGYIRIGTKPFQQDAFTWRNWEKFYG